MKKKYILFIITFFSFILLAQPQLEHDVHILTDKDLEIGIWLIALFIIIFGIGATVINLKRGEERRKKLLNKKEP